MSLRVVRMKWVGLGRMMTTMITMMLRMRRKARVVKGMINVLVVPEEE
jgi:hypothetical protein